MVNDPVVDTIVAHVAALGMVELPPAVRAAAKAFIIDTLGVAVAGALAPWRAEVLDMAAAPGGNAEASVLGSGERLPLAQAAMVNAYQIHAQEFDCVHEGAVVHPMAASLPCLLGWAERAGGVSGETLLRALVAAVDVAVNLGLSSRAPMRFFRPANAGGFGAVAGLAIIAGLGEDALRHALGIYYGACAGTMQAHLEATPQLAMQMGFAARSAVTAVELARRFMPGPRAPITGKFGYFALFDGAADSAPFDDLGRICRVAELSHKPFPSGRATHGGIDALQRLMRRHGIAAAELREARFRVPPLTHRLVGRPATDDMSVAYARLSLPYVGAVCLRTGTVGLGDFTPAALSDPATLELARRLTVLDDGNPDPNALLPQRAELDLADGRRLECTVTDVLGSPARPLSPEAARAKFDACWAAAPALALTPGQRLWGAVAALEDCRDVRALAALAQ